MENYSITISPALTNAVKATENAFGKLNRLIRNCDEPVFRKLMEDEARASHRLSETVKRPCFSFGLNNGLNQNKENIMRATIYGVEASAELPLSTRLIKNLHYLVCGGPDYDKKYRGEIRKSPVWIGEPGASIESAVFISISQKLIYIISNSPSYDYFWSFWPLFDLFISRLAR